MKKIERIKDGQYVRLLVRITPSQDKALKAEAKKAGLSLSAFIRNWINANYA